MVFEVFTRCELFPPLMFPMQKVQDWDFEKFPIDLKKYKPFPLDPTKDKKLSQEQKDGLVSV